jgi:hypothetical protein
LNHKGTKEPYVWRYDFVETNADVVGPAPSGECSTPITAYFVKTTPALERSDRQRVGQQDGQAAARAALAGLHSARCLDHLIVHL